MTPDEFTELNRTLITVDDLRDITSRTLLYGYNVSKNTCHLYLKDGLFHYHEYFDGYAHTLNSGKRVVYPLFVVETDISEQLDSSYIPNRRIYPAKSDASFCRLLREKQYRLSFAGYDPKDVNPTYAARLIGEDYIEEY